jgi:hypothetical protein
MRDWQISVFVTPRASSRVNPPGKEVRNLSQLSTTAGLQDSEERKAYWAPSLEELGSLVELTLGDGTSTTWDMGSGKKKD